MSMGGGRSNDDILPQQTLLTLAATYSQMCLMRVLLLSPNALRGLCWELPYIASSVSSTSVLWHSLLWEGNGAGLERAVPGCLDQRVKVRLAAANGVARTFGGRWSPRRPPSRPPQSTMLNANAKNTRPAAHACKQLAPAINTRFIVCSQARSDGCQPRMQGRRRAGRPAMTCHALVGKTDARPGHVTVD